MALALFWPDCIELPIMRAKQFRYGWDGHRMDRSLCMGSRAWVPFP
jgi:hypothetical protein